MKKINFLGNIVASFLQQIVVVLAIFARWFEASAEAELPAAGGGWQSYDEHGIAANLSD